MKKTPKRHLLRHTSIYTAMLLAVSSQQAFGASDSANFNFIVNDDGRVEGGQIPGGKGVRPGEKFSPSKGQKGFPKGGYACQRLNIPSNGGCPVLISIYHKFDFTNTDTLLAGKTGKLTFGGVGGGSAPLWGKFSGLNADNLAGPKPDDWLTTTHKGKMGYDFSGISCYTKGLTNQSRQCPNLPFRFNFNFEGSALNPNSVKTSPDGLPIYMLKDHPWLGVSFQLGTSTDNGARNWMAINGNNTEIKQRIAKPTDEHGIGEVFELRAKLHPLGDPKNLPTQEIKLGQINMPDFGFVPVGSGGSGRTKTFYDIFEHGHIDVKLRLPDIDAAAGGCTQAQYTNPAPDGGQYAIVAPAPLGAGFPGRAAAVVTDPKSASSRILFYTLDKDNKKNGGADYLPSKDFTEPVFTGRKAAIRLANGVSLSTDDIAGGSNGIFGIGGTQNDEWKKVLLPWTDRRDTDDNPFKTFNNTLIAGRMGHVYSQQYRIREGNKRDLGDIVNSPITAVGDYLATAANDGMVHIFQKSGNGYNLKLSYIPGTMPRKNLDNQDSNLAKDLHNFADKNYTGGLYGVDGGFVLRKVNLNGQDRVFMFGAMGQGGKGAYALDLTRDKTGVSLFDVKNGENGAALGYTVGTPQIGKIQNGKYAAFLASGYAVKNVNSGDNTTALYVYDLESNGTLIKKIDVPGGKGGLSSPTLVDTDLNGTVDIAYAGDRGGNMYRFDLSNWSVRTIFRGTKPITSAPAVSQLKDKRVVIFGTGSDLTKEDVASQNIQSVYGIFDDKKEGDSLVVAQDVMENKLLKPELIQEPTKDGKILFLKNNEIDKNKDKGWAVDLQPGQRVTIKPTVVLHTAFVTIHNYNANGCGAETAFLGINTDDGGELTKKSARPVVPDSRVAKKVGEKKDAKRNNIPVGCMEKGTETVCPSGYVYPKLLTASYLDSQKTSDHPTTADGDAGGSGTDTGTPPPGNRCFSKGAHTLLMNDMSDLDVVGPTCMKRISWREIFF